MPKKKAKTEAPEELSSELRQAEPAAPGDADEGTALTEPVESADEAPEYVQAASSAEAAAGDDAPNEDSPGVEDAAPEDPGESGPETEDAVSEDLEEGEDMPPVAEQPSEEDMEYDALLHELSETGGEQPYSGEEDAEPLILDPAPGEEPAPAEIAPPDEDSPEPRRDQGGDTPDAPGAPASFLDRRREQERERILTIQAHDEVQTEEDRQAVIWHEIQNADWTRRILTGTLDGVEQTPSGLTLAVVNYKGIRVAIPVKEMLLHEGAFPSGSEYRDLMDRLRRILMVRLGSEIDFIVKGHDNKSRSAVGSRKEAMYRKRQSFYLDKNELGEPLIYEGRVVQARVVSVVEKSIRVEAFGVECAITARGLSRSWVGDAAEQYSVGDRILVRITRISGNSPEELSIAADVGSVFKDGRDDLGKCVVQGRYAGRVTDIRGGVVYVRLNNGVNAIAHSCYDRRTPGKRDDVSFSVTKLDPEQGVAVGIITRIIKQNL